MCLNGHLAYTWNSQHSISAISTLRAIRLISSPEAWTLGDDRPDRIVQLFPTFLSSHASQWSRGPRIWRNEFWCERKITCVVFVVLLMCVRLHCLICEFVKTRLYALICEFVKTICFDLRVCEDYIMLWFASLWRLYTLIWEFVKTIYFDLRVCEDYILWFASLWRLYTLICKFVKTRLYALICEFVKTQLYALIC